MCCWARNKLNTLILCKVLPKMLKASRARLHRRKLSIDENRHCLTASTLYPKQDVSREVHPGNVLAFHFIAVCATNACHVVAVPLHVIRRRKPPPPAARHCCRRRRRRRRRHAVAAAAAAAGENRGGEGAGGQGPGPGRTRLGHWPLRSLAHRVHGRCVPGPYLQSRNMTFGRILRFVSNL